MKATRFITAMVALCLLLAAEANSLWAQQIMSVQVQEAKLRKSPSFLAEVTKVLAYGDTVTVIGTEGDFQRVVTVADQAPGWLHTSALTEKTIVMQGGGSDVAAQATSDEIALAGKGFNKQVEESYARESGLDYGPVDKMQSRVVPDQDKQAFLVQGGLADKGGF